MASNIRQLKKILVVCRMSTSSGLRLQKKLHALITELDAACKETSPEFMKIGEDLQIIYRDAKALTAQVGNSVEVIGGQAEGGVLFKLRGLADASMNELTACSKNLSVKGDLSEKLRTHLGDLWRVCGSIQKTGLLLRIVAVNIGIESSRSTEAKNLFLVVGQETSALSKKIAAVSGESLDVLKSARAIQQSSYRKLSEGLKEIDRLGRSARRIVGAAVQEIETLMETSLEVTDQARKRADAISGQVGELVIGVQFHDDMTQRVAHVREALEDIKGLLTEDHLTGGNGRQSAELIRMISILGVQSAQLKEIITEIEQVHEKGVTSFEEIHWEVDQLLNHLSFLSDGRSLNPERIERRDGPFKRLSTSFRDLDQVLERGQALIRPMQDAGIKASEAAEQVLGFVQEIQTIGFETHLMALNSIVKAARLGSTGGALEVLSQEIKQAADQTASLLDRTGEVVGQTKFVSSGLRQEFSDGESVGKMEGLVAALNSSYSRFIKGTASSCEQADMIGAAISKTKSDLDFLSHLRERFTGALEQLEQMAHDLSASVAHDQGLNAEETEELRQRYTMEKERRIHEASLSGELVQGTESQTPEGPPGSGEQLPSEIAEATDNGELFADEPETETTSNANVELFDEAPDPESQTGEEPIPENGENQKEKEDFGDNVELF